MKNKHFLKLWLIFMFIGIYAFAEPVGRDDARKVAVTFLGTDDLDLVYTPQGSDGNALYYVFALKNGNGYVMVAGNNIHKPVLGYSHSENFRDPTLSPYPHISEMFRTYHAALDSAASVSSTEGQYINEWSGYLNGTGIPILKSAQSAGPLLQTQWGQELGTWASGVGNSPAGCVATAIGQVMYYHSHPTIGTGKKNLVDAFGNHIADFGERDYLWETMSADNNNDEVSRLLYHISVGISSSYNPQGTGAMLNFSINTLRKYFQYSSDIGYSNNFTGSELKDILIQQILKGNPVIVGARSPELGGHAMVCDGYDGQTGLFHINWGWNGYNNGYFDVLNITGWNLNEVVYEIKPDINPVARPNLVTNTALYPVFAFPCGAGTHRPQALLDFNHDGYLDYFDKYQIYNNHDGDFLQQDFSYVFGEVTKWVDHFDIYLDSDNGDFNILCSGIGGDYGGFYGQIGLLTGKDQNLTQTVIESFQLEEVVYHKAWFVDLVGDEKPEISVIHWKRNSSGGIDKLTHVYENNNGTYTLIPDPGWPQASIPGNWDIDQDGKKEFYAFQADANWSATVIFSRVVNSKVESIKTIPVVFHSGPYGYFATNEDDKVLADFDNDGIPEIVVTVNEKVFLLRYNGDAFEETMQLPAEPGINANIMYTVWNHRLFPVDFNADGLLDLAVPLVSGWYTLAVDFFENKGNFTFEKKREYIDWSLAANCNFADIDNNGYTDMVMPRMTFKNTLGGEKTGPNQLAPPPSGMTAIREGNDLLLSWIKATDDRTPQNGLSYNVRIGTAPGKSDVLSPAKLPGIGNAGFLNSLKIKNAPEGTLYVQIQTIDHSMTPGTWSEAWQVIDKPIQPQVLNPTDLGIVWFPGTTYEITWRGFTDPYVKIELLQGSTVVRTVTTATANDGTMLWKAPSVTSGTDFRIRVTSTVNPSMTDISDNFFAIGPLYADLNKGLVAYYPFNQNANDESGNANHGTVYGAQLTNDRFGNPNSAYHFPFGSNAYISGAYSNIIPASNQNMTISFWVKFDETWNSNGGSARDIFHLGTSQFDGLVLRGWGTDGVMAGIEYVNSVEYSIVNGYDFSKWYFVSYVHNNDENILYIDGQPVSSKQFPILIPENGTFVIGTSFPGFGWTNNVGGCIDDINIYDRALNPFEIQGLYTIEMLTLPRVTYPSSANLVWNPGSIYEITWKDFPDPYVRLELLKGETVVRTITNGTANDGTMLWKAPSVEPGDDYRIRVTSTSDDYISDLSDNFFAIRPAVMPKVNYPSETGLVWNPGTVYEITWQGYTDPYVKIELLKGSTVVRTVTSATANDGTMLWKAPSLESGTDYRIRITSTATPSMGDISDNNFALQPTASPLVTYPSGPGIVWYHGTIYEITWHDFTDPYVKVEVLKGSTVVRTVTNSTANDGVMLWRVPALEIGNDYRIRISSTANPATSDISDNTFSVAGSHTVIYPSLTDITWNAGTVYEIKWQNYTDPYVKIELLKGETVVRTITSSTPNDGSMLWRIASTLEPGNDYRVRITSSVTPTMTDVSDNPVTIVVPKSAMAFDEGPETNTLSVYPNPFSDMASITYTIAEKGRTLLEIYDLTGRKVTTLQDATMEAGTHVTEWNATDTSGKQVVPGIYLVRIQSGGFVQTEKIVFR